MIPIGQWYCEVCDAYITRKNFCQHLKTCYYMKMDTSKKSQSITKEKEIQEVPEKKRRILKEKIWSEKRDGIL